MTLNERVAKAKGWRKSPDKLDGQQLWFKPKIGFCHNWANDLNAAWELVEEMRTINSTVVLRSGLTFCNCEVDAILKEGYFITEAICLAYLSWKG